MQLFSLARLLGALCSPVLLCSLASAQSTWFVDVNATPPGLGTPAQPYASIQYAVTRPTTLPNDFVVVAPGLYVENIAPPSGGNLIASGGPLVTELRPQNPGLATVIMFGGTITGFTLTGCSATGINGGALNLEGGWASHCIVRNNTSYGVFSYSTELRNCTIVDNNVGIVVECFAGLTLRNTIVWANPISEGCMGTSASYCAGIVPAGSWGTGNLVGDPGLWPVAGSRHLLRLGSPCIDAGDPASPLDPDGTRADIGAVPFDPYYAPPPAAYCVGKLNSQGCVPAIGAVGSASVTGSGPFTISAVNEPDNKPGLMFFGFGKRSVPFQGGTYCVDLPIKRVGVQNSGGSGNCGGSFSFDMQAYIQSGVHAGLQPGAMVYCQWWNRDPLDPAGYGSGLSNALSFGIAP